MLQGIREKTQGWFAWTIVIIIVGIFGVMGVGEFFTSRSDNYIAATVGDSKITWVEVDTLVERLSREERNRDVPIDKLKEQILSNLVQQRALLLAAKKQGLDVSESQIKDLILSIPVFHENGVFNTNRYAAWLKNYRMTDLQFRENILETMLINQFRAGLVESAFALPQDVARIIKLSDQKRDIQQLNITQEQLDKGTAYLITPDNIQDYYEKNKESFKSEDEVKIAFLYLNLEDLKKGITLTEQEVKAEYDANPNLYEMPPKAHVAHILVSMDENASKEDKDLAFKKIKEVGQKLKENQSFESLAKEYSDDTSTNENGGDLGWIAQGQMANIPQLDAAIFKLQKVGDTTEVESPYGIHIVKLINKEDKVIKPFDEIKQEIKDKMLTDAAEKIMFEKTEKMVTAAFENSDSLDAAASVSGLNISTTGYLTRKSNVGTLADPKVVDAMFSDEVVNKRHNSELIEVKEGEYIILRALDYKPSAVQPFEKVSQDVKTAYTKTVQQNYLEDTFEKIKKAYQSGKNLADIGKEMGYTYLEHNGVSRMDPNLGQEMVLNAFDIPRAKLKSELRMIDYTGKGAGIIAVKNIENGDVKDLDEERLNAMLMGIGKAFGDVDYNLYVNHTLENYKIDNHPKAVEKLTEESATKESETTEESSSESTDKS